MVQLKDAVHNSDEHGYTPKNDITSADKAELTNSLNVQNPATVLQHQFLEHYGPCFPEAPVYIVEYHRSV